MQRIAVSDADRRARAAEEARRRGEPFVPDRWDVALIPCTSKKRLGADTAITLYDGPRFQAMVLHAAQRAQLTLIMSAKYGLLELLDPVSYYDSYLPDLGPKERAELLERVRCKEVMLKTDAWPYAKLPRRILSYLPKAYHELLVQAKPAWEPLIRRPYANCTMFTILRVLKNEIINHGKNPARR